MRVRKWFQIVAVFMLIGTVLLLNNATFRTNLFVKLYNDRIETSLAAGNGVPADDALLFGYESVNTWKGEHPMTEFLILARGDTYYGVYYSPDDVPVPFQNSRVELTQDGHDYWVWQQEGDNHGATSKIQDRWYYFEASI